jgi:hypothetical protein
MARLLHERESWITARIKGSQDPGVTGSQALDAVA